MQENLRKFGFLHYLKSKLVLQLSLRSFLMSHARNMTLFVSKYKIISEQKIFVLLFLLILASDRSLFLKTITVH